MTRSEIVSQFREENPEITSRVITDTVLNSWLLFGDKDFCSRTRCIVDQDGTTISTTEDDQYYDLTSEITSFFDIDEYPGGGVTYNDKRLTMTTIAELDRESPNWRSRDNGTPKKYYRRGPYMYLDRPVGSDEYDIKVYAVLKSNDFDSDVAPYNELTHLEPFHYGLVKWLKWKAKEKIGKRQDAIKAQAEYVDYTKWVKLELGGGKYGPIYLAPSQYASRNYRMR